MRGGSHDGAQRRLTGGTGQWGGRAVDMTLNGTQGRVATTGEDFRTRVGLKSSWFTLQVTG
jgi:peptidoglycan hydrolase-like amidase